MPKSWIGSLLIRPLLLACCVHFKETNDGITLKMYIEFSRFLCLRNSLYISKDTSSIVHSIETLCRLVHLTIKWKYLFFVFQATPFCPFLIVMQCFLCLANFSIALSVFRRGELQAEFSKSLARSWLNSVRVHKCGDCRCK